MAVRKAAKKTAPPKAKPAAKPRPPAQAEAIPVLIEETVIITEEPEASETTETVWMVPEEETEQGESENEEENLS